MVSDHTSRRSFLILVALAIGLLAIVISPFAEAFLLAAVLAGALMPLMERLARHTRNRRNLAAGLITAAVLLLLLAPLTGLAAFIVGEALNGMRFVSQTIGSEGMAGLVRRLPEWLQRAADWVIERFPIGEEQLARKLNEQVTTQGTKAAAAVTGVLSATGAFVFQAAMMLIAFYCFLVDGPRLVRWLEQVSPLKPGEVRELLSEFRRTSVSVIVSTVATSGVQAVAALVGYLIARVPYPLFFTALTFFIAFVPALGAASVCLVASALVLATGHPWAALFLAIWAVTVVGLVDNVAKPLFVRRGMDIHGAVIFFALLGGLAVFGAVGLLIGPLVVAFFLAVVRMWHRDYGRGPSAAGAVASASGAPGKG